ncbi:NlpC/P60 family protein [Scandinavium goeteborgense]|uniref:NlpC/P60 family protein n=1 Tax=Scandinavium goeteborgense TaxID=1851514 RepID=A0A4R6E1C4_SCAGO|nr:NlpC/P60 family protein [Scandinavium goeteborgense]TDN51525.1 NlpC/P60 family protein [Scandinavium goeteborgense]
MCSKWNAVNLNAIKRKFSTCLDKFKHTLREGLTKLHSIIFTKKIITFTLLLCTLIIFPSQEIFARTHHIVKKKVIHARITHIKRKKTHSSRYHVIGKKRNSRHPRFKKKYALKLNTRKKILKGYLRWKGTRYQYGGNDHHGIDCSALVRKIYSDAFGIHLPRTTRRQIKMGQNVFLSQLKPGDLVFFLTGKYDRHVGIYVGNKKFIHASKIKGVTISEMKNIYWKDKFLAARRVMIPSH